jgi:hypothetical protein
MVCREWKDHLTYCYFCLTIIDGHNSKSKHTTVYPGILSALRPVKHDDSLPIPKPPQQWNLHEGEPTSTSPEYEPGPSCCNVNPDFVEVTVPHLITQSELKDLVRDLNLSKMQAELLASHLQGWHLLQQGVKVSYRKHQQSLSSFFSKDGKLVYCNDVEGLLHKLGCTYNPEEWRLFVYLSQFSLKVVLLHNRNIHPSIPIAHSVHMKETYANMDLLLKGINYSKYGWKMRGDLKVIGLLLGTQSGYTRFCCFLCEWDSRTKTNITKLRIGPCEKTQFQGKSVSGINS